MKKAIENKSYKKVTQLKEFYTKDIQELQQFGEEIHIEDKDTQTITQLSVAIDENDSSITIQTITILNEVPYGKEFIIDLDSILSELNEKESHTITTSEQVGNLIITTLQQHDIEFNQNGAYGIQSEWLKTNDNELFNIGYNTSDLGKAYIRIFKLRKDEKEEEELNGNEDRLNAIIGGLI
jgi:hypothetical protein